LSSFATHYADYTALAIESQTATRHDARIWKIWESSVARRRTPINP
jgi:hypothetical protein